ncbi:MAG TPA: TetR family transcriptional regulator, partial [Pseudomonadales bacterium]|nr:TetR family transcriptional regulator [Pseudomonadales bacterium]
MTRAATRPATRQTRAASDAKVGDESGRHNQRRRTRKDLLTAAATLMRSGAKPSLEAVAEAAMVSRATAYRYFPSIEALL